MSNRKLVYHCLKNHPTHRDVVDPIDILAIISCEQCGEPSYLLGTKQLEVETQEPVTLLNRAPWWTQQVPSECILCSGSGICGGLPCACQKMAHL